MMDGREDGPIDRPTDRREMLSHIISLGSQLSFDIHHAYYVPKHKVLRSSEVNEGQPKVSHLSSNLLTHIFFVKLLILAFM